MNPFGAATGLGKANASVDSADATADALARVEVGASSSAGSSVPARSGGVAAAGLKPAAPKKGLMMRMPRAHLGTTPMKFSFQAQDLQVTLSTVGFEGRLVLAFKRGNDRRETEPMQLKEEVRYALRGHTRARARAHRTLCAWAPRAPWYNLTVTTAGAAGRPSRAHGIDGAGPRPHRDALPAQGRQLREEGGRLHARRGGARRLGAHG